MQQRIHHDTGIIDDASVHRIILQYQRIFFVGNSGIKEQALIYPDDEIGQSIEHIPRLRRVAIFENQE